MLRDLAQVAESFARFHARFAPLFGRKEARRRSEQYLQGLLVQDQERRSAENLAEAVPGATPRALQRFLSNPRSHEAVLESCRRIWRSGCRRPTACGLPCTCRGGGRTIPRCRLARVPAEVGFASKPDLALALLRRARAWEHLQAAWVTAEEGYGGVRSFREALAREGWWRPGRSTPWRRGARATVLPVCALSGVGEPRGPAGRRSPCF